MRRFFTKLTGWIAAVLALVAGVLAIVLGAKNYEAAKEERAQAKAAARRAAVNAKVLVKHQETKEGINVQKNDEKKEIYAGQGADVIGDIVDRNNQRVRERPGE